MQKQSKKQANKKAINASAIVAANKAEKIESENAQAKLQTLATHELTTSYAGASKPYTTRKSRTPISAVYNSLAGAMLTERDTAFLAALKAKYGKQSFPRLNADAEN